MIYLAHMVDSNCQMRPDEKNGQSQQQAHRLQSSVVEGSVLQSKQKRQTHLREYDCEWVPYSNLNHCLINNSIMNQNEWIQEHWL